MDYIKFEEYLIRQRLTAHTISQHVSRLKTLIKYCAPLNDITVNSFIANELIQKRKSSGSQINKYVQTTHKYCQFKGLEWLKKVAKVHEESPPRILFSNDEIEAFLSLHTSQKMDLFWLIRIYCGTRPSEPCQLTVDDIDFEQMCMYLNRTKTSKGRAVPIPLPLEEPLKVYIKDLETHHLFPGMVNRHKSIDKPMSHSTYLKDFWYRKEKLGIKKNVTPNSFRHSFITRLLTKANQPLFVVQDIAGHKSPLSTRKYYHGSLDLMHEVVQNDPMALNMIPTWDLLKRLTNDFLKAINSLLGKKVNVEFIRDEDTQCISIKISVKKQLKGLESATFK